MDSMHQEVQHEEHRAIREYLVNMEQEAMKKIFQNGPDDIPEEEANNRLCDGIRGNKGKRRHRKRRIVEEVGQRSSELEDGPQEQVHSDGCPEKRHHIPFCPGAHLQKVQDLLSWVSRQM